MTRVSDQPRHSSWEHQRCLGFAWQSMRAIARSRKRRGGIRSRGSAYESRSTVVALSPAARAAEPAERHVDDRRRISRCWYRSSPNRGDGQVRVSGLQRRMTSVPQAPGLIALAERIELWPVDRLRPYERNPRTHSDEQVDQIAASIVEFGWTNPALVDEQGGILAGPRPPARGPQAGPRRGTGDPVWASQRGAEAGLQAPVLRYAKGAVRPISGWR